MRAYYIAFMQVCERHIKTEHNKHLSAQIWYFSMKGAMTRFHLLRKQADLCTPHPPFLGSRQTSFDLADNRQDNVEFEGVKGTCGAGHGFACHVMII